MLKLSSPYFMVAILRFGRVSNSLFQAIPAESNNLTAPPDGLIIVCVLKFDLFLGSPVPPLPYNSSCPIIK